MIVVAIGIATGLSPVATPPSARAAPEVCGRDWGGAIQLGRLPDGLVEVSGFVSSARHPGVAWMIRDSDNPRSLYSFTLDGDRPSWKEFKVSGVSNYDWEDLAYTVGADGRGRLWILENAVETGPKTIYEVLEPDPSGDRSAHLLASYRFEYPGGNLNTEAMFAVDGHLAVVAKTSPNHIYRLPSPLSRGDTNRAVAAGRLDVGSFVTMASTSADERLLAIVATDDVVTVIENRDHIPDLTGFANADPLFEQRVPETQHEAGDFFPHDSCDIVLVSEDATVWRLPNHGAVAGTSIAAAPTVLEVTAGDGHASISWSPPAEPAGTPPPGVLTYRVAAFLGASEATAETTTDGSATSAIVAGLTNGETYTFTVTAVTASGPELESAPSPPVTIGGMRPPAAPADPARLPSPRGSGYWMLGADGTVHAFGDARHAGQPTLPSGVDAVDLEPTPTSDGYWVVDDLGSVHAYGDARHLGDVDGAVLSAGEAVTSLSRTPSGNGYWIFTSRGRVVTFGDAGFFGDMSQTALNGPVLDSIPTPTGLGYYLVASDGGVFTFGDASFRGSMGATPLNAPVKSLVPDPDGTGYWLVAADGGVFAFDAPFRGSMGGERLNRPVSGMVASGNGYLMVGEDGGVFNFSDRPFAGSLGDRPPARPIVSMAAGS